MNYTEVVDAAFAYADRNDAETTSKADYFLRMVEARINRALRTREQMAQTVLPQTTGVTEYALPSDFAGVFAVHVSDSYVTYGGTPLLLVSKPFFSGYSRETGTKPIYYIDGSNIVIWPATDGKFTHVTYYKRVPELTSSAAQNWVSQNHPDCYVFGMLVEICSFLKDPAAVAWDARFKEAVMDMVNSDWGDRWNTPTETRVF